MDRTLVCLSFSIILVLVGAGGAVPYTLDGVQCMNNSSSLFAKTMGPHGPENLTDRDDAFHESDKWSMEWWYFDVISDNGYSIEVNINIFARRTFGFMFTAVCVYKNMELIHHVREIFLFNDFFVSSARPLVKIRGDTVMSGSIDAAGIGVYNVVFPSTSVSVDLHFTGTTPGWKLGDWSVVLPKSRVRGMLRIDDSLVPIKGTGYHDHNWNVTHEMVTQNEGWLWGKNIGQNLSLIWAQMVKERSEDLLFVMNEDNQTFCGIQAEDVQFEVTEYMHDHGRRIPSKMRASVSTNDIRVNLSMEVVAFHYIDVSLLKYWRYHVRSSGTMTAGSTTEEIHDDVEIMEYITFNPFF